MNDSTASPHVEDLLSVGSRISWGAILAGTFLAMGVYFLLATLGAAVGLSTGDRLNPTTLQTGVVAWVVLTIVAALFVGGLVTSLFTVGENKMEAVINGVIMWALLFSLLLVLGAIGVRSGINVMLGMANVADQNWEVGARAAGVPAEQIKEWQRKHERSADQAALDQEDRQAWSAAARRISWYTFAGTWLSMIAAAAGGLLGAGPTFRIVAIPSHNVGTGLPTPAAAAGGYSRR